MDAGGMELLQELEAAYAARKDTETIEAAALERLMYDWAAALQTG